MMNPLKISDFRNIPNTIMKLPKLKDNLKISMLSLTCVGGLVSCYPVTPVNPVVTDKKAEVPSGVKSPEEIAKAKAKKAADLKKSSVQRNKERLEREEKARIAAERKEAAAYKKKTSSSSSDSSSVSSSSASSSTTSSTTSSSTTPSTSTPKTTTPSATVKYAAPVPGKDGFCYNPWTHNQVDVRGIPSGTKVRDPHDSNPAHIFKVP